MKHALAVIASGLTLIACADETRTVTVSGQGVAEAEPTHFSLVVNLLTTAETRDEAARLGEAEFQNVTQGLETLAGLEELHIQSDAFAIGTLCEDDDRYRYGARQRPCEPIAYVARQTISVDGAPAVLAGNAASLATELGAEEASILSYYLKDMAELERQAFSSALTVARQRADAIAASSEARLGDLIEVIPEGFSRNAEIYRSAVSGEAFRAAPLARAAAVDMSVRPAPVQYRATAYFTYELTSDLETSGE